MPRRADRTARGAATHEHAGHSPGLVIEGARQVGKSIKAPSKKIYLDEFSSRFNRRNSSARGMLFCRLLELAVGHDPVRYKALIPKPEANKQVPNPPGACGHPPSLASHQRNDPGGGHTDQRKSAHMETPDCAHSRCRSTDSLLRATQLDRLPGDVRTATAVHVDHRPAVSPRTA